MTQIPHFILYGDNNPEIRESIQPSLRLRSWGALTEEEKEIVLQELENNGWFGYEREIVKTIEHLNHAFLRKCPGKHYHGTPPDFDNRESLRAAIVDFKHVFLQEKSEALVFHMLSKFVESSINVYELDCATKSEDTKERESHISSAFQRFDCLADCLNHIFEQFSINQVVTRRGFVPRQDEKITSEIYTPTLKILSDPKWRAVNADLSKMFEDYQNKKYAETITKAHSAVQRFLQILVGEEGKSGKGEISKLFAKAKKEGIIPANRFTEPVILAIQAFIPSERATNSTAKPALKEATSSDALLMMNVVMILLQHCLSRRDV